MAALVVEQYASYSAVDNVFRNYCQNYRELLDNNTEHSLLLNGIKTREVVVYSYIRGC